LLDGSPTISDEEFQTVLNFTSNIASKFNVTPDNVQLGLSVFSNGHKVLADLNTTTNLTSFQNVTTKAEKPPGKVKFFGFVWIN